MADPVDLKPHPKNPRVHPDSAVEKLAKSLQEFGWTSPVLVSADGFILAGHARVKAAVKTGIASVPVIDLPLSGAKAEAYLIADNRLGAETDWDMPVLSDLLSELAPTDIAEAIGMDPQEWDFYLGGGKPAAGQTKGGPQSVRVPVVNILIPVADVAAVEKALRRTGELTRGAALAAVCQAYLGGGAHPESGQFDAGAEDLPSAADFEGVS